MTKTIVAALAELAVLANEASAQSQAAALLEGAPAEVVIADTAYDADHVREAVAEKGAEARRASSARCRSRRKLM